MQPFDSRQADEVATLLALAEHGSFAAAGRALQRHPSVLSKRLGALERRLGIRLVERTTRQLRFTDEGERLASRFRQAVDLLDEAEHEASLGAAQLRGRLRIALPSAMGRLWLGPLLAEFALAHPQVVLETDYSGALRRHHRGRLRPRDPGRRTGRQPPGGQAAVRPSAHPRRRSRLPGAAWGTAYPGRPGGT